MEARTVIKMDAAVEVALGVALLVGFGGADFPHPVGRVLVLVVGAALIVFGVFLWRAPVGLQLLAAGNLVTAAAAIVWLAAAGHFSPSGAALVGAAAAALVVLAACEAATLRR
jgi:hypothetical protein